MPFRNPSQLREAFEPDVITTQRWWQQLWIVDPQLWGGDAEWEPGTVLCESQAWLQDSAVIQVGGQFCSWLSPCTYHSLLDSCCNYLSHKRPKFKGKAALQSGVILIIDMNSVTPRRRSPLSSWCTWCNSSHLASIVRFHSVKVHPLSLFRDAHLSTMCGLAQNHISNNMRHLHLQTLAVVALPASLQTGPGRLMGCTSPPEDKAAAITLTSWQLSDRGTDSEITPRKALCWKHISLWGLSAS